MMGILRNDVRVEHAEKSTHDPHLVPLAPPESMRLDSDHMVVEMSTWVDTDWGPSPCDFCVGNLHLMNHSAVFP